MSGVCGRVVPARVIKETRWGQPVWGPLHAELTYTSAEPWAVTLRLGQPPVDWVVARELLREGMTQRAGLGDVVLWPSKDDPRLVFLQVKTGVGAVMEFQREALAAFLVDTDRLVPPGTESSVMGSFEMGELE